MGHKNPPELLCERNEMRTTVSSCPLSSLVCHNHVARLYRADPVRVWEFDVFESDGDTSRHQWVGTIHNMKVQVGFRRIPRVSQLANNMPSRNHISLLHLDVARLQMCVE